MHKAEKFINKLNDYVDKYLLESAEKIEYGNDFDLGKALACQQISDFIHRHEKEWRKS